MAVPDVGRTVPALRMEQRMSDTEALMWKAERDPVLRSAFLNITICDSPLDVARFRRRMAVVVDAFPRLRQRVIEHPVGAPSWVEDTTFDLDHHVRHVALAAPGSDRQLLDLAADLFEDAFDPARPLWTFVVLEGLSGGRGALLSKLHHTITDGVGGIRMSGMFIDLAADQDEPSLPPPPAAPLGRSGLLHLAGVVTHRTVDLARAGAGAAQRVVTDPGSTAKALAGIVQVDRARSPLWRGRRGVRRHLEVASFDLEDVKASAKRYGGTVNDVFVTALCQAVGDYHRARDTGVGDLRISMPVSTRKDKSAAGNSFVPARILVPCGDLDLGARFDIVHDRLYRGRFGLSLGIVDGAAGAAALLPPQVVARFARQQTDTVDFAASNVRGAPFDTWIAGAKILHNHPMGPTGGTAFIATVLSTGSTLDLGLCTDQAAVEDPAELRERIVGAFAALRNG
jgi:diacylglycerol O-acyltransferase